MRLVLASGNRNKLREYRQMLEGTGIELVSQTEAGFSDDVEETGSSFEENSRLKAEAVTKALGVPALADDSGLEVLALGGAPGIYSARYGGGGLTDGEKCRLLLHNLADAEDRRARFVCVITCVFPGGDILQVRGECPGRIGDSLRGENGFGYDPVFFPEGETRTMAELSEEEKNAVSHRGTALREFRQALDAYRREKTGC